MAWEIRNSGEYLTWYEELSQTQKRDVSRAVDLLRELGVGLDHPHTSKVNSSRHGHMRELRVQSGGRPLRIFYAFDPLRAAILLIGGDKTGNSRFYMRYVQG